jgi:hypothetical protein
VATILSLPVLSIAAAPGISAVITPSTIGVTTSVYVSQSMAVNAPFVPLEIMISVTSNPVTNSLNWAVTVKSPFTNQEGDVVSITAGRALS